MRTGGWTSITQGSCIRCWRVCGPGWPGAGGYAGPAGPVGAADRVFEVTLEAARAAGLVGRRWVLDSTPLYDAVATMDTVTLVRPAIRGLLKACGSGLAGELRRAAPR
jgi:hypothetical protein